MVFWDRSVTTDTIVHDFCRRSLSESAVPVDADRNCNAICYQQTTPSMELSYSQAIQALNTSVRRKLQALLTCNIGRPLLCKAGFFRRETVLEKGITRFFGLEMSSPFVR